MRTPTLRKPGPPLIERWFGRTLLLVNWSKDWDGWGETKDDGKRVIYKLIGVEPFIGDIACGVSFYLWRLMVRIGVLRKESGNDH